MSVPVPAKYIAEFEERGFGMFIHWGLYSQLQQGEYVTYEKSLRINRRLEHSWVETRGIEPLTS